jgi:threonine dehydrogenase-like Zn-dependent dehydrogenase
VVLKTTIANPIEVDLAPVVVDELRLVGSRCGDIGRGLDLLASERVDPRPLIDARYALREAEAALEHAARPGTLKVVVRR